MATIQQLKNFLRHGKQARVANNYDDSAQKQNHSPPRNDARSMVPASEPALGVNPVNQAAQNAFSVQPGLDATNCAAQAGNAAAHHAEAGQAVQHGIPKGKRIDESNIAKLVAEEAASKSKFPKYPGLERWELLEKMGDGAFSNVYRARDREGTTPGEVAIKVVRKFEMSSMQGNKHLHPDFKPKAPKAAEVREIAFLGQVSYFTSLAPLPLHPLHISQGMACAQIKCAGDSGRRPSSDTVWSTNTLQRANILKEVQIMRQLDHPNIIKLIDFTESKQYYYIILELAPGGELFHQIVRLTYFSEDLSRHVIVQVAKALEYLHEERGVVHRDIKPENILFVPIPVVPSKNPKPKQPGDEDKVDEGEFIKGIGGGGIGLIKIADFGLSKIVWDNQTMTPCGTVGYTAPEIVKDERYSKSVDMWALGCVLYTLLCGFPPFYDESIEVLTEKVAKGQYTFLSPWWDDISKSAQDLISHLLTVDPEKRFTITEFLAHPWIRGSGPTPRDEKKFTADGMLRAFDAGKLQDGDRRYDFRSPGAVNLREVFDVGYAVHRQEEEGKRRKQIGAKAAGVGPAVLNNLNEEDEDSSMPDASSGESNEYSHKKSRTDPTQQIEQRMRNANIRSDKEQRGRERESHKGAPTAVTAEQQRGYGQHSAAVTAAARQQVRDRNRQKGAFELNLDGATLLGRRGAKPAAPVA